MIIFLPVTAISSYFSRIFYCLHIKKFFSSRFTSLNYYFTSYWNRFGASSTKKTEEGAEFKQNIKNDPPRKKWYQMMRTQHMSNAHSLYNSLSFVCLFIWIYFFFRCSPYTFFLLYFFTFLNKSYHITLCLLCHTLTHTHIELGGAGAPNSY